MIVASFKSIVPITQISILISALFVVYNVAYTYDFNKTHNERTRMVSNNTILLVNSDPHLFRLHDMCNLTGLHGWLIVQNQPSFLKFLIHLQIDDPFGPKMSRSLQTVSGNFSQFVLVLTIMLFLLCSVPHLLIVKLTDGLYEMFRIVNHIKKMTQNLNPTLLLRHPILLRLLFDRYFQTW